MKALLKFIQPLLVIGVILILFIPNPLEGQCWEQQYPTSDAAYYADIFFLNDQLGWRIGNAGIVEKTENGGQTWYRTNGIDRYLIGRQSFPSYRFSRIWFVNESVGFLIGGRSASDGLVYRSTDGGENWELVSDQLQLDFLEDLFFFNETSGWIVGTWARGYILNTTDGGEVWNCRFSHPEELKGIYFSSASNGWAVGENGLLVKTTDGGQSWEIVDWGQDNDLNSVYFHDDDHGWIAGDQIILRTTNGGQTWIQEPQSYDSYDIYFLNSSTGFAVGDLILKTTNGGDTWIPYNSNGPRRLNSIASADANNLWAVGYNGLCLQSTNQGNSWDDFDYQPLFLYGGGTFDWAWEIQMLDETTGYSLLGTRALKTTDGGDSWEILFTTSPERLGQLFFASPMVGWVGGKYNNLLYKTSNGGNSWTLQHSNTDGNILDIYFLNETVGWVLESDGDNANLLRTLDGGMTWNSTFISNDFATDQQCKIQFFDSNNGYITVGNELLQTDDGGISFSNLTSGFEVTDFDFLDETTGWIKNGTLACCPNNIEIYRTTNGGNDWEFTTSFSLDASMYRMAFFDENVGWMVGRETQIYYTIDGGFTWGKHFLQESIDLTSISIVDRNTIWISGNYGLILKSNFATTGCSPHLVHPENEASNVSPHTQIEWEQAGGCATGYYLSLGTSPGAEDLLSMKDMGSDTQWDPEAPLPTNQTIYVSVYPYTHLNEADACEEFSFTTGSSSCRTQDSLALVALYVSTNGPNWDEPWNLNDPIRNWQGLDFNENGCVSSVNLDSDNLFGPIPDDIGNLSELKSLTLSYNNIFSPIPASIGQLTELRSLSLQNSNFNGELPASFQNLTKLENLSIQNNFLMGSIPEEWNNQFPSLAVVDLSNNYLSGTLFYPASANLYDINLENNQVDSLPDFSDRVSWYFDSGNGDGLNAPNNQLTFDDILPNMPVFEINGNLDYAPQDSVYTDTLIIIPENDDLTIDLGFDDTVSTNSYHWFKNGQLWNIINGSNEIEFTPVTAADAGNYHVQIQNPNAPDLTLFSKRIQLQVGPDCSGTPPTSQSPIICQGENFEVGSNSYTSSGIYMDTLMAVNGCDSIVETNLTVEPSPQSIFLSGNFSVCESSTNNYIIQNYSPAFNYSINQNTTNAQTQIEGNAVQIDYTNANSGTICLTTTSNGFCSGSFETCITVDVFPVPSAVLTGDATICEGETSTLTFELTGIPPWDITYSDSNQSFEIENISTNNFQLSIFPVASTTFSLEQVNTSGCSGGISGEADIEVLFVSSTVLSPTICEGESFEVGSNSYASTGIYFDTLTAVNGCDSTIQTNLTVDPLPQNSSLSGATQVCTNETETYQIINYDPAIDYTILSNTTNADATINGNTLEVNFINAASGTICLQAASSVFCNVSEEFCLPIEVLSPPLASISGDVTLCNGQSTTLFINLSGDGPWTIIYEDDTQQYTINNTNENPYPLSVSPTDSTTYSLISVSTDLCQGNASGSATVHVNSVSQLNVDTLICKGESITVGNNTYSTSGMYLDTLVNSTGCDSIIFIELDVIDLPVDLGDDWFICEGEEVVLNAALPGCTDCYYQWSPTLGDQSQQTVIPLSTTTYIVEVERGGCTQSDTLTVFVNAPSLNTINETICEDESIEIAGQEFSEAGLFEISLTDAFGCDSTILLELELEELQIPLAQTDEEVLGPDQLEVTLEVTQNDNLLLPTFQLSILEQPFHGTAATGNASTILYSLEDTRFLGVDSLVYEVCQLSCREVCDTATARIIVQYNCIRDAYFSLPTGISPNGDGKNDLFDPLQTFLNKNCSVKAEQLSMIIVNQWGEVIFQADPYLPWIDIPESLPQATYYMILNVQTEEEEITIRKPVLLIRND
jgi:photosystem II stability/assembly factor-like uncharacterized protein